MDFKREIEIKVSDKASRVLDKINRTTAKISKSVSRSSRSSKIAERATLVWGRAVERLGRVYDRVRRKVAKFGQFAARVAKRVTQALAATGIAVAGGTFTIAGSIRREANAAEVNGLDVNTFRLLREYIKRAGGLDSDGAAQLIQDILEKQSGAREEQQRAVSEGKKKSEATGTEIDILKSLGLVDAIELPAAQFIDKFLSAFGKEAEALFVGLELGEEGKVLGRIGSKSVAERAKLEAEILDSVRQLSKEDVQNARDLGSAFENLRATIKSFLEKVLIQLTPSVTQVINQLQEKLSEFLNNGGADKVANAIRTVGEVMVAVAQGIGDAVNLVSSIIDGLFGLIEKARERYRSFVDFFGSSRESRDEFTDEASRDRAVGRGLEVPAESFSRLSDTAAAIDSAQAAYILSLQERNAALHEERAASQVTAAASSNLAGAMESAAARINATRVTAARTAIPLDGGAEATGPF